MKKKASRILALGCTLLLVGCGVPEAGESDFEPERDTVVQEETSTQTSSYKLVLRSGNKGATVEITDRDTIEYITDNLESLTFTRDESSENYNGWNYWLKWYDEEELIDDVVILNETKIDYNDYFYQCSGTEGKIDIAFLEELLEQSSDSE